MTLDQLIDEYKKLPALCYDVDYSDKKAVKRSNDSARRMYEIVELVQDHFGSVGVSRISALLDIEDYHTNRWLATQLLERVKVDDTIKAKALSIIKRVAATDDPSAMGFQVWLQNWNEGRFVH